MSAPEWARALVDAVCADACRPIPRLAWRTRRGHGSTGMTRRDAGLIAVRAGTDPVDARLTLLHELAHWLTPVERRRRRAVHHGLAFYAVAFDLYRRHGLAEADALRLESARYRGALRHATRLGVDGADHALAAHRAALRARPRRRWRVLVPEHAVRLEREGRWTVCATCRQRVVGSHLAKARRARRPLRHVLWAAEIGS
jgi:hypothetical protein